MLTAALAASTSVLGTYNLARFAMTRAIKARRKAKAARALVGDIQAAVSFAKKAYEAVSDGVDPEEAKKIAAIAEAVKKTLGAKPTA